MTKTKLYDSALPMSVPITRLEPHDRLAALADPGSLALDAPAGASADLARFGASLDETAASAAMIGPRKRRATSLITAGLLIDGAAPSMGRACPEWRRRDRVGWPS